MKALEFCYAVQGFAELALSVPTEHQWAAICKKAKSVDIKSTDHYAGMMSPVNFVTWLLGFIEIAETTTVTDKQWAVIREHLDLVFTKVTSTITEGIESEYDFEKILDQIKKEVDITKPWTKPDITKPWTKPLKPYDPYIIRCASHANELYCAGQ